MATSTWGDAAPPAPGSTPTTRLPGTCLAPRLAASLTPAARPPGGGTQPRPGIPPPGGFPEADLLLGGPATSPHDADDGFAGGHASRTLDCAAEPLTRRA